MKLLLDENVPKGVYKELQKRGYDVVHILFLRRGMKDKEVIEIANREGRTIITLDEDFIHLSKFLKTRIILIRKKFLRKKIPELVDIIEKVLKLEGKIVIIRDFYVEILERSFCSS